MWKLLYAVIVVAVLSTYADADRERGKHAIRNRRFDIQNDRLQPPINHSVKGQEAIVIESEFLGYNYSTPKTKTDGYVYTTGYIYVTPTTTRKPTVRTTKPSTPGTTYLPPGTKYLPPGTTYLPPGTTYLPPKTTPTTPTTTSTTTPTTTTLSTTPYKRITYLPPPEPPKVYLPVREPVKPYPSVIYSTTEKTPTPTFKTIYVQAPTPTLRPSTSPRPTGYYLEYLPPKKYLPAFITRK